MRAGTRGASSRRRGGGSLPVGGPSLSGRRRPGSSIRAAVRDRPNGPRCRVPRSIGDDPGANLRRPRRTDHPGWRQSIAAPESRQREIPRPATHFRLIWQSGLDIPIERDASTRGERPANSGHGQRPVVGRPPAVKIASRNKAKIPGSARLMNGCETNPISPSKSYPRTISDERTAAFPALRWPGHRGFPVAKQREAGRRMRSPREVLPFSAASPTWQAMAPAPHAKQTQMTRGCPRHAAAIRTQISWTTRHLLGGTD